MRSNKSRSRGNKSNRNNRSSGGNNINRVFDSSGPEGKVRGTPQQIIDKYQQLTRDSQLSNDRVAAENFQQHAEHYARLLGDAQREAEAKRIEQENQQRERQAQRDAERTERDADRPQQDRNEGRSQDRGRDNTRDKGNDQNREDRVVDPSEAPQPELSLHSEPDEGESALVDTPEAAPKPKPARKPRARKPKPDAEAVTDTPDAPEAAE